MAVAPVKCTVLFSLRGLTCCCFQVEFLFCFVLILLVHWMELSVPQGTLVCVWESFRGSAGSAFCFPYNSVTVRRILFKFGRFRQ